MFPATLHTSVGISAEVSCHLTARYGLVQFEPLFQIKYNLLLRKVHFPYGNCFNQTPSAYEMIYFTITYTCTTIGIGNGRKLWKQRQPTSCQIVSYSAASCIWYGMSFKKLISIIRSCNNCFFLCDSQAIRYLVSYQIEAGRTLYECHM